MIIPFTTVLAFASLYLPQPILPLLAAEFGVEETDAALLTAVTMIPLGIAPIAYGFVIDRFSAKHLLRGAVGLLMLSGWLLAIAPSFWMLLALRFAQGLLLPAAITALMTYTASTAAQGRVRNALNVYIGTSILGGVSGRLMSGVLADLVHWRAAFALLGLLLTIAWFGLGRLRSDTPSNASQIGIGAVREAVSNPIYRNAFLGIFCVFFVFASLLNYLPFRLKALDPTISEAAIAAMYLGYLIGVVIALNGVHIADRIGGEVRVVFLGLIVLAVGLIGVSSEVIGVVYAFVFCLCAGFFLIHSSLTAYLNHVTAQRRGVINGLYIASYYAGGAVGGWLPGFVYRSSGWHAYLAMLLVILVLAGWWVRRLLRADAARHELNCV